MKFIGQVITGLCKENNINQGALAASCGITHTHLSRALSGKNKFSLSMLEKIANRFDLTVLDLIGMSIELEFKDQQNAIESFEHCRDIIISLLNYFAQLPKSVRAYEKGKPKSTQHERLKPVSFSKVAEIIESQVENPVLTEILSAILMNTTPVVDTHSKIEIEKISSGIDTLIAQLEKAKQKLHQLIPHNKVETIDSEKQQIIALNVRRLQAQLRLEHSHFTARLQIDLPQLKMKLAGKMPFLPDELKIVAWICEVETEDLLQQWPIDELIPVYPGPHSTLKNIPLKKGIKPILK